MPQPADIIGRTLARTYQIERLLGGGGMGAVYAARHVRTGGIFAVKVLHRETAADAEIYKRFQDEARTVSALRHPHIVQVTDFDRDDDATPFIVMELLEGEDLYQRLCRVGTLPLDQVLDIGRQVGSALHAAHEKGIIHRDIKPQNIFLTRHELADMITEAAKVVDFGISKIRRTGAQMTRDMTILGTPQFMSPEAALGQNSQLDGRADQWSLAVIMYLALSGRLPFDGENLVGVLYMVVHEQPTPLKQLCPEVPDYVVAAINRAMSKKKDERFPRMADFVRALMGTGTAAAMKLTSGLQMGSAVFRVPTQLDPALQQQPIVLSPAAPLQLQVPAQAPNPLDAPTAVPHLGGTPPRARGAAAAQSPRVSMPVPQFPPFSPSGPEAATVGPQLSGPPESAPTRPNISDDNLPMTMPASQPPPELVATPSHPTAMSPFLPEATRVTVKPKAQSGDTPTSISMNSDAIQELTSGIDDLGDSASTPKDQVPSGSNPALHGAEQPDPLDLQSVPTRVAMVPHFPASPPPPMPPGLESSSDAMNATIPLTSLRKFSAGSAVDTAYPSTLSRATGQQGVSMGPRRPLDYLRDRWQGLKNINWQHKRERALAIIGVAPLSPQRLAIAAGSAGVLLALLLILILSSASSPDKDKDKDPKVATPPPTIEQPVEVTHPPAAVDAGEPAGSEEDPSGKNPAGQNGPGKKPKTPTPPTKKPPSKPSGKSKPKLF
jgi:serine/threonine protein kinase